MWAVTELRAQQEMMEQPDYHQTAKGREQATNAFTKANEAGSSAHEYLRNADIFLPQELADALQELNTLLREAAEALGPSMTMLSGQGLLSNGDLPALHKN